MRWLARSRRTPIGLDVGARSLKAVQLRGAPGAWRIEAAAAICRTECGPEVCSRDVQRLCDVLYRQGFTGQQVVLAVPHEKLVAEVLELPSRGSGAPLDQIARMELARTHRKDPESFEMSLWDLPAPARAHETTSVMTAACSHADADAILDCFEGYGLDVLALDVQAWALARACAPLLAGSQGIEAIFDIGWTAARLVLLHDDVVIYERTMKDAGLQTLHQALSGRFDLDDDAADHVLTRIGLAPNTTDQQGHPQPLADISSVITPHVDVLVRELKMSLSYAAHRYPDAECKRLFLVGGGSAIPKLADYLTAALGVPVEIPCHADMAECNTAVPAICSTALLTTAIGLAQYLER
ncbi:MAG: pilus assembly protein PilM [Phycisphaeraceae bacterium]